MVNCAFGTEHLEKLQVLSAVIGVFDGLMSASVRMHRKRVSGLRFVKDVVSLLRRWVVSLNATSRSIGARSRALGSIAPDALSERSSSDENEVSLARNENCADFLKVSLKLSDPSKRTLAACAVCSLARKT